MKKDTVHNTTFRKKKNMRFPLAVLLSGVMLLSMAACGVQYGGTQSAAPSAQTQPAQNDTWAATAAPTPSGAAHFSVETAASLPNTTEKRALSTIEIYQRCNQSVVAISTSGTTLNYFGQQAMFESAGSGVIISSDGYILTCNHVIEDVDEVRVVLNDGAEHTATVVGGDKTMDLAVLKIDATGLVPVTLGDSDQLQVGELAVAIGNPLGQFANSQTTGTISGKDRALNVEGVLMNLLQHDASISPGNSGGGLFNSYGELIGITSAKSAGTAVEGVGFAIPINDAKAIINDLVNYGFVARPQIGISGVTISEETAQQYDLPIGVYIAEVVSGGAADEAGIVVGDVITKVDGRDIKSIEELTRIKNEKEIGETLALTVMHAHEEKNVTLTLKQEEQATPTPSPTAEYRRELPEGLPPLFEDFFR